MATTSDSNFGLGSWFDESSYCYSERAETAACVIIAFCRLAASMADREATEALKNVRVGRQLTEEQAVARRAELAAWQERMAQEQGW